MRRYESIVVIDGSLREEDLASELKKVEGILAKRGAKEIESSDWGRRTVAYPLRKKSLGHYHRFEFVSERPETVQESTVELLLSESILKIQTHKITTKVRKFKGNPKRVGETDSLSLVGDDEEE